MGYRVYGHLFIMETMGKKSFGIGSLVAEFFMDDAVAIAIMIDKIDRFVAAHKTHEEWAKSGAETPEPVHPLAIADPIELLTSAKAILKKCTFVNIGASNVFDDVDVRKDRTKKYSEEWNEERLLPIAKERADSGSVRSFA